jgi:RNA polymerase sigma-70 factor (ECF subfamily)
MNPPRDERSSVDPEDARLVAAVHRGDRAAFAALYDRHAGWMTAVALRHVGDRDAAADVVQDALLHWLGRFPGFVATASVRAYLYPVVRHCALDRLRRDRRPPPDPGRPAEDVNAPDAAAIDLEDAADLDTALGRLPAGQREVLLLHYGDGFQLAEIAAMLEIPLGTVKSRLGLALAALRTNDELRRRYLDFDDS